MSTLIKANQFIKLNPHAWVQFVEHCGRWVDPHLFRFDVSGGLAPTACDTNNKRFAVYVGALDQWLDIPETE